MKRVLIIVQARMGSGRFPGKSAQMLGGRTVVEHVVRRAIATGHSAVLAVPHGDDFSWLKLGTKTAWLFVDEEGTDQRDVLGRYLRAAEAYVPTPEVVVRLTGDCPFVPVDGIEKVINEVASGRYDYAETRSDPSEKPNGIDAQAFTLDVLRRANESTEHREDMTAALMEAAHTQIEVNEIEGLDTSRLPGIRLTVDVPEDLERYRAMLEHVRWVSPEGGRPTLRDLCTLFVSKPELFEVEE